MEYEVVKSRRQVESWLVKKVVRLEDKTGQCS